MTLSGQAAEQHPGIDTLTAVRYGIVTHHIRQVGDTVTWERLTAGPGGGLGRVDPETGTYRTATAAMTEAERRKAGLRRNGLPRRRVIT